MSQSSQNSTNTKKKFIILGSILGVAVLALGGFLAYNNSNNNSSNEIAIQDSEFSEFREAVVPDGEFETDRPTPYPSQTVSDDPVIQESREELDEYLRSEKKYDPVEIKDSTFDFEQVVSVKDEIGQDAQVFPVEAGKQVNLTINYSSVGDENFNNGTLFIKLSKGLKIVPGSMVDFYGNQGELAVSDSVFNPETNLISYGPGTTNKLSGQVPVGQKGSFKLTVEVSQPSEFSAVSSYMQEEGGQPGKPDIVFIES